MLTPDTGFEKDKRMLSQTTLHDINGVSVAIDQPVVLEQNGNPIAVLISVADYQDYQQLRLAQTHISASQAQRAANQRVFGDLVGCALSCGEPVWVPGPEPHWRIPYRLFDGTLAQVVTVDGNTGTVNLTDKERDTLLAKIVAWVEQSGDVSVDAG